MEISISEPDYLEITRDILSGSDLSPDTLEAIAEASKLRDRQLLAEALGDGDFSWPWFDTAFEAFDELDQWPELPAWSWFESKPDLVSNASSVLAKLNGKTLKNIAQRAGIAVPSSARVGEIRTLLGASLSAQQLKPYADALNRKLLADHEAKASEAKRLLLSKSISMRAYNFTRHQQLVELLRYRGDAEIVWGSPLAQTLAGEYEFRPNDTSGLPPFFPGDETTFKANVSTSPAPSSGKEKSRDTKLSNPEPDAPEPQVKSTTKGMSTITYALFGIAMVLWVVNSFNETSSTKSSKGDPVADALGRVDLKASWHTAGFGSVMEATFTVSNPTAYTLRDIEITCDLYGKSGTRIDRNTRTIYEVIRGRSSRTFEDVNMGFINSQSDSARCRVSGLNI